MTSVSIWVMSVKVMFIFIYKKNVLITHIIMAPFTFSNIEKYVIYMT